MDKYKELSKQLRYCGDVGKCQSCEFDRVTEPCSPNLLGEAADAIEDLIACLDTAHEYVDYCKKRASENCRNRCRLDTGTNLEDLKPGEYKVPKEER